MNELDIEEYMHELKTSKRERVERIYNYKAVYLVIGLKSNIRKFSFGNDFVIRKSTKEEFERFDKNIGYNGLKSQHVVEFKYSAKHACVHESIYDFSSKINFFFLLFGDKRICLPKSINYIENQEKIFVSSGLYTDNKINEFSSAAIQFERNDFEKLKKRWINFERSNNQNNKAFNIAWTRFLLLKTKYNQEDKLIDCMIAFEALFLKESEHDGISYKLALRVAYLLRNDFNKNECFEFLKSSYGLRSKVVHGSNTKENIIKFKGEKLEIMRVVEQLLIILSSLMKNYIETFSELSIEQFINRIDQNILDSF